MAEDQSRVSSARRIAVIHNRYLHAGGEDRAADNHVSLLKANGCPTARFSSSNTDLLKLNPLSRAAATLWNRGAYLELREFFGREKPQVAHFHNIFPLLSPAAYAAARDSGIAVVQSLHNYRLACPNALLFRDGRPCEDCLAKRVKWPGVVHACYRNSRLESAVTAGMLAVHAAMGTWQQAVHVYIALTEFGRRKFIEAGLPADRIVVSPSYLAIDPGQGSHAGGFALFVGRLSTEKGIGTLLDAARMTRAVGNTLKIVGSGPLEGSLDHSVPGVEWLGDCSNTRVLALMRDASVLVFPSTCYEAFPMTLVEAFATGLPVIASGHGAMAEIVEHDKTGRLAVPGDPGGLAEALTWAFDHPSDLADLGEAARATYESYYTAAHAYERLQSVYERAVQTGAS